MNIRYALELAERFLDEGLVESTEGWVSYAEYHLDSRDPNGTSQEPVICCFMARGSIIHCGSSDKDPLFPGTLEERVRLCRECRDWCREKIKELKTRIAKFKEAQIFAQAFFAKKS